MKRHRKDTYVREWILISLIMEIISQGIHVSKHHIIFFEYIQFLFANHTSVKLKKEPGCDSTVEKLNLQEQYLCMVFLLCKKNKL
jgi:hypothetical protein